MRRSSCDPGLCTPGVSTNTICAAGCFPLRAGTSTTPAMRLRVVCGLAVTMATFSPMSAFSSVLLPTLGRPRMATNPDFKGSSSVHYRGCDAEHCYHSPHDPRRRNATAPAATACPRRRAPDPGHISALGDRAFPAESRALAVSPGRSSLLYPRNWAAGDEKRPRVALDPSPEGPTRTDHRHDQPA